MAQGSGFGGSEQERVSSCLGYLCAAFMLLLTTHWIRRKRLGVDYSNLFFLAGELAAPEQSYRTVANVLARMSCVPATSPYSQKFNNILSSQIVESSDQDSWFLSGGAMQVGVTPDSRYEVVKGALVCESLVARCLWESHWREEWCGVYKKGVVFYAPLTQKPCLELCK